VPRNRTARQAVLGASVRRPTVVKSSSRTSATLRRRLVVGGLVLLALVLVTLSFREEQDGPVSGAQSAAASALRPFQVAADRIAVAKAVYEREGPGRTNRRYGYVTRPTA